MLGSRRGKREVSSFPEGFPFPIKSHFIQRRLKVDGVRCERFCGFRKVFHFPQKFTDSGVMDVLALADLFLGVAGLCYNRGQMPAAPPTQREAAPRPADAVPPRMCLSCGLVPTRGAHRSLEDCVDELRSRLAMLEDRAPRPNPSRIMPPVTISIPMPARATDPKREPT